ncbi:ABC-2 type transporter [Lactococcus piscium]|uniref:Transport permease protein n=2 Tax=Pseudolactococcus piscium TaxID=1364 RepID=A0A2A5S650_9LACT|nr:ABC-2 type transporter [Lactococcus piscium]
MKFMIKRDLLIQLRDKYEFIFRVAMLPFILILVYGYVLPKSGILPETFPQYMFPGIIGMSLLLTGIHGTAIPLTMDFNMSREIEDRLQAPIKTSYIAISKMIVGIIQSWIGALIVLPISLLFMRHYIVVSMTSGQIIGFFCVIFLASFTSAALGLLVGTIVKPNQIAAMFPGFLMPIVFTGAIFFTWDSLAKTPLIQKLVLINPLLYINEALRSLMIPNAPSIPIFYSLLGIIGFTILMGAIGYKRFKRLVVK